MISEPYRDRDTPTWLSNTSCFSALWLRGRATTQITIQGRGKDYVWAKVSDVTYASVYLTPNCSSVEFERIVAALKDTLGVITGAIIPAGDVNARAIEWGMTTTNKHGWLLLEMAARLELTVANVEQVTTYRRPGYGTSIPDVTFVTNGLLPRVEGSQMFDGYMASDD